MMKEWLGGKGRQPVNWATLVAVLRNAGFSELADRVEQLVPTLPEGGEAVEGRGRGRGRDRIEWTIQSSLTEHQSNSSSQGEWRGREEMGGGSKGVSRGGGATVGGYQVQSRSTFLSHFVNDQSPRGNKRGQKEEGGGGRMVGRGRGRGRGQVAEGVERRPGQVWVQDAGRGRGRVGRGKDS